MGGVKGVLPHPPTHPAPPPQILVGSLDRAVRRFSTEKGKFTESRLCPGGEGPFCGLAAYDR